MSSGLKCIYHKWTIRIAFVTILFSINHSISATTVFGYVISNSNDTVFGEIQLPSFDLNRKLLFINSYNFEDFYTHVFFKKLKESTFELYNSDAILEFGFSFESFPYRFISKEVNTSITKVKKKYFYLQVHKGAIDLFERNVILYDIDKTKMPYGITVSDYYIMGEDKNLILVSKTSESRTVFDFLSANLKVDPTLLSKAIGDKSFKDIFQIVELYNQYVTK